MPKTVAVIDGNSLMHRAFHAVPPTMNAPDGTPTNAVFGFLSMLLKFIDIASPDAIICAFDAGRPAFRMEALERYKAQRPPMDPDLKVQFAIIEDVLESMNIPVVKLPGWEGDDILGTVAARDERLGYQTLLVTGDKDAYQLASDLTRIVTTKKGITDVTINGPAEVYEKYGVTPEQFPDFLGLMGDSSDNIPGVPGIGPKTATKLLQQYGTIEGLYEHVDELKGKQKEKIVENRDAAFISRQVATIVRDADIDCDIENVHFPSFDAAHVIDTFQKYRFSSHLNKVLKLIGEDDSGQEALQFELKVEPSCAGNAAHDLVRASLDEQPGYVLGISFVEPAQESLFSGGLYMAVACEEGIALFEGDGALEVFADIVRRGSFAIWDVKDALHRIYPADSSEQALVAFEDIAAMRAFDVSVAAYVLNSSVQRSGINDVVVELFDKTMPETKADDKKAIAEAAAVSVVRAALIDALKNDGSWEVFDAIDLPLVAVLCDMERTGAAIDVAKLKRLGASTQEELAALSQEIYDLAGEEFNIDSPKQLSHILFEVIGLTPRKKTTRGYSTDASVLRELSEEHDLPKLVLHYRELAKIKSTYIDALPRMRAGDGRVHTSFNETVTTTGRLSSSEPNLQNIPVRTDFGRQIRECFVPLQEGHVFMSADYSQIELRLLAHLSGDEKLIEAFLSGADFHTATAANVFGLPVEEITPALRSRAKAVNFGIVYGQQAFGLAQSLGIPFGEAKEMIERYFAAYPGVRAYLDQTVADARSEGYAQTMFGRKRHIPEISSSNANQRGFGERTAMNHPMQGSAADIIKLAMVQVRERMQSEGFHAQLLLQVHDELDFSVPEDEVEAFAKMVHDSMEHVVQLKVPLEADVSWGATWAEAH